MPEPTPNANEEHDEFIERCMGNETMQKEYPEEDQRYAVCQAQWEKDQKSAPANVERRWTPLDIEPIRVEKRDDGSRKIVGLAAVYYDGTPRTEYTIWEGVRERIRHGAFAALLKAGTDTRALFNHDPDNLLGRTTTGSLKLKSTRFGLEYEITPPDTQTARDVVALLQRGDLTGSSFSFLIGEESWKEDEKGDEVREIKQVAKLFDVGPVTFPCYEATTANARSLESWRAERAEAAERKAAAERAEAADRARAEKKTAEAESLKCQHYVEQIEQYADPSGPARG